MRARAQRGGGARSLSPSDLRDEGVPRLKRFRLPLIFNTAWRQVVGRRARGTPSFRSRRGAVAVRRTNTHGRTLAHSLGRGLGLREGEGAPLASLARKEALPPRSHICAPPFTRVPPPPCKESRTRSRTCRLQSLPGSSPCSPPPPGACDRAVPCRARHAHAHAHRRCAGHAPPRIKQRTAALPSRLFYAPPVQVEQRPPLLPASVHLLPRGARVDGWTEQRGAGAGGLAGRGKTSAPIKRARA